jgi:hypothetical protein
MMVPSMQRALLTAVLGLQPTIRSLIDPFAGSGTVIVEGTAEGLDVTGHDINPLAVLLCRAKTEVSSNATLRRFVAETLSAPSACPIGSVIL